jgi:pimeloyl-ACP methyl ester carboxylesterase
MHLWRKLTEDHHGCDERVELRPWNSNWSDEAEMVYRFRNGKPRLTIAAYSWGAGWGAMQFARELNKRGIEVESMVLSDPVYRNPHLTLRWLTTFSFPIIRVPENVRSVRWFRQKKEWPCGHELMGGGSLTAGTVIHDAVVAECGHLAMDELPAFHAAALEEAAKAHNCEE